MARKTTKPPEAPPPPAALTMSRADAHAKLSSRIEKADEVRQKLAPAADGSGTAAEEAYDSWNSHNYNLLQRMFTDRTVADEYHYAGPPAKVLSLSESQYGEAWLGGPRTRRVDPEIPEKLAAKAAKLRVIRGRLEVYDEPVSGPSDRGGVVAGTAGPWPTILKAECDTPASQPRRAAFIVHGHDDGAREATARVLQQLDVEPIILHEQPNQGRTILEKFEAHAGVPFAIVLLTPDDVGGTSAGDLKHRARQNVVLELGYFWGKLSRSHVYVLYKEGVELPSDLGGLLYVKMDEGRGWRFKLAEELDAAGIPVDFNRLRGS